MRYCYFLICLVIASGCCGVECDIASYAANTSNGCDEAAIKTFNALNALGFQEVKYCVGYVCDGYDYHAWVEYNNGDEIVLDPYRVLDGHQLWWYRDDLFKDEYVVEFYLKELPKSDSECQNLMREIEEMR
jgi:hypothetical protein